MSEKIDDVTLPEVVAVMVHDLNNPIAALATNLRFLETLLGPAPSSEMAETLSDTHMLCEMLRRLVSNLSLLGQTEPPTARRLTLDVVAMGAGTIERLRSQAIASEIKLVLDTAVGTGAVFVESDPMLCERALDNLLAFAMERATSRSQIVVSIMNTRRIGVRIVCTARPETPDVSAHPSRSRELQAAFGRGLPLHCARMAADAMGSRVDVHRDERDVMTLELTLHTDDKQIA
jgi:K+-sensing histidine kinase KdpD